VVWCQNPRLIIPVGHNTFVNTAVFSSCNKYILTSSADKTAKVWNVSSGNELFTISSNNADINSAVFSKDDKEILTVSSDKMIRVWSSLTGNEILSLRDDSEPNIGQFNPNGNSILTASTNGIIKLWNRFNKKCVKEYEFKKIGKVKKIEFNNRGDFFITIFSDNSFSLWNINNENPIFVSYDSIYNICHFNTDTTIIQMYKNGSAKKWRVQNEKLILFNFATIQNQCLDSTLKLSFNKINNFSRYFSSEDFEPSGKYVISRENNNSIKFYEANSGILITDFLGDLNWLNSFNYSASSERVLIPTDSKSAKLVSLIKNKVIFLSGGLNWTKFSNFSKDGSLIAFGSYDGSVLIYNAENGNTVSKLESKINSTATTSLTILNNKNEILTASTDGYIKIISFANGKIIKKIKASKAYINSISISTSDSLVATTSDSVAKIWNLKTGEVISTFEHNNEVYDAKFSHNGKYLATVSFDSTIKIWNLSTGALKTTLHGHTGRVYQCEFLSDDSKLASASSDSSIIIWDLVKDTIKLKINGHTGSVNNLSIDNTNSRLATGSSDSTVKIWNLNTGELIKSLDNRTDWVEVVRFSPDSKLLATGSDDGLIKIWNIQSGSIIKTINSHSGWIWDIKFDSSGDKIFSTSSDSKIIMTNLKAEGTSITYYLSENDGWLSFDNFFRYDGSSNMIDKVYLLCDNEIVNLNQIKKELYVPHLLEIINAGISLDELKCKKINDLNICNGIPFVDIKNKISDSGLIEINVVDRGLNIESIEVFANGICQKTIHSNSFKRNNSNIKIHLQVDSLFLIAGLRNVISIRAKTDNNLFSEFKSISFFKTGRSRGAQEINIFAIVIGVSDYLGDGNSLNKGVKYAKDDAADISRIIKIASSKLLINPNEQLHLFIFNNSISDTDKTKVPLLNNIQLAVDSIARIATENDMIVFYFAGHGTIFNGEFKMLTAECFNKECQQGITSSLLSSWFNSSFIKAQKRVFILDACNSGRMFNDIVSIRADNDLLEKSAFEKELYEFGEYSGMVGIAASMDGQTAAENDFLGHGLLTYCLLNTIKKGTGLSHSNLLVFDNWFEASKNEMQTIGKTILDVEQDAQLFKIGNPNLLLGKISSLDQDSINLNYKKPRIISKILFFDAESNSDFLSLSNRVINEKLSILKKQGVVYSSVGESTNNLTVIYKLRDQRIKFTPVLFYNNTPINIKTISGDIKELDSLINKVLMEVGDTINNFYNKNDEN